MNPRLARALFLPSLAWEAAAILLTSRQWWNRIDDCVYVGALPIGLHARRLYQEGVRGVINMCNEYQGPTHIYQQLGIRYLHLPTPDFSPPSLTDVLRGVGFIQEHWDAHESVYLHCKAGRGRSATLAVCWLIQSKGVSAENAESFLREQRHHVDANLSRRDVVIRFVDHLKAVHN